MHTFNLHVVPLNLEHTAEIGNGCNAYTMCTYNTCNISIMSVYKWCMAFCLSGLMWSTGTS